MRICLYVEPLLLHSKPHHYWAWLQLGGEMLAALQSQGVECRIVTSETLAERGSTLHDWPRSLFRALRQRDIKGNSRRSNLTHLSEFHRGTYPEQELARIAQTLKAKLDFFEPDLVLTWSPAPFFKVAFPEATVLHIDCGMASRAPFPMNLFFDPTGLFDQSVPGQCGDQLLAHTPSEGEASLLRNLRSHFGAMFEGLSPLQPVAEQLRTLFDTLWLLPLQFQGEMAFETTGQFRNVGEVLWHVMEAVPANVGVIVTEHPTGFWTGDYLDAESLQELRRLFPNCLLFDELLHDRSDSNPPLPSRCRRDSGEPRC